MKKIYCMLLSVVLILWFSPAISQQNKVINTIIQIGQTDNQTMNHLDVLTNRFGGRLIGSDAFENAAQWVAYEFRKWGMEVQMDEVGTLPVGFDRGPWFGGC